MCLLLTLLFFTLQLLLLPLFVLTASGYDSSLQFNPQGRLLQLEYSQLRVEKGGAVFAFRCADGVLLISIPNSPKPVLHISEAEKIVIVDEHIAIAATGLLFDAKAIIDSAIRICLDHRIQFGSPIPVETLGTELVTIFHSITRRINARPIGVSLLIAGTDAYLGNQVYCVTPEGSLSAWNAICVGKESQRFLGKLNDLLMRKVDKTDGSVRNAIEKQLSVEETWNSVKSMIDERLEKMEEDLFPEIEKEKFGGGRPSIIVKVYSPSHPIHLKCAEECCILRLYLGLQGEDRGVIAEGDGSFFFDALDLGIIQPRE